MKKLFLLSFLLLGACAQTEIDSNASMQTKMKACMLNEANSRLQAGTLFNGGVKVVAEDIVNTCLNKLALQAAGISEESQSTAQTIIQNLKSLSGNS